MARGRTRRRAAAPAAWSVACVLREPPEQVRRFAAFHLDAGAERVHLIFDDPNDPSADALEGRDGIEVTRARPAFWDRLRLSPETRFTQRQNAALTWAYRRAREDWIGACDADEGLHAPGGMGALLGAAAPSLGSVVLPPAEAVDSPGGEVFRLAARKGLVRGLHGEAAALFGRNYGLVGHSDGKSLYRTGQSGLSLRQHWANGQHGAALRLPAERAAVLHWVSRGWEAWRAKLDWRLAGKGFRPAARVRLRALLEAGDEAGLRAAHDALHRFDARQARMMDEAGLLLRPALDWAGMAARHLAPDGDLRAAA